MAIERYAVGIIPDGNRRWAEAQGWSYEKGCEYGLEALKAIINKGLELSNVSSLVVYLLSKDNVAKRPKVQVDAILDATEEILIFASQLNVGIAIVGDPSMPIVGRLQQEYTQSGEKMDLYFLLNWSPEWDKETLYTASEIMPMLDLVIRTSGDKGLSGFVPLQSAYAKLFFPENNWPDFSPGQFQVILEEYSRMGKRADSGA